MMRHPGDKLPVSGSLPSALVHFRGRALQNVQSPNLACWASGSRALSDTILLSILQSVLQPSPLEAVSGCAHVQHPLHPLTKTIEKPSRFCGNETARVS